jgi:hypothetical protein
LPAKPAISTVSRIPSDQFIWPAANQSAVHARLELVSHTARRSRIGHRLFALRHPIRGPSQGLTKRSDSRSWEIETQSVCADLGMTRDRRFFVGAILAPENDRKLCVERNATLGSTGLRRPSPSTLACFSPVINRGGLCARCRPRPIVAWTRADPHALRACRIALARTTDHPRADQKSGVVACGNGRCGIPMKEFGFSAQIASVSGPWAV